MRPIFTDKIAVIGIVAGLVLWVCCLTVLWGWAYDPSGSFALLTLLTILAAGWFCLWRRGGLVRWARRILQRLRLLDWIPLEAGLAGRLGPTREDAQLRMRLLSAAAVLAVVCFVFSTLWIPAARFIAALLGQVFLFSDWTWRLLEVAALLVGAFPVALGLIVVGFASSVVRAGSGRDVYAAVYRDWLWGVGLAFAAFAVSWWFGANLIYLVFSVAGGILLAALTGSSRGDLATHPRRRMLPFGPPPRSARMMIAIAHASLVLVIMIQMRMLGDIFSLSLTRRMLWAFLSVLLLVYFLGRVDRKTRPPGRMQINGAIIVVGAAMLVQSAEMILCLSLSRGVWVVMALAVATQIPLASMGATILSYQRRNFAIAGGSVGQYLTAVFGGLVVAVFSSMLFGAIEGGWIALLVVGGAFIVAGGAGGVRGSRRLAERLQWTVWSSVACASLLVGLVVTLGKAAPPKQQVQPGVWLTSAGRQFRSMRMYRQDNVLPRMKVRRSEVITRCLYERYEEDGQQQEDGIFARRRGKWWIVSTSAEDLPAELPGRVYAFGSNPESPHQPRRFKRWPPLSYSNPDYFQYARLNFVARQGCDYYDGILLAPLPADHPQAWRCYNEQMMRRCKRLAEMRNPDGTVAYGVVVLRTQVARDRVREALSVARTFHKAVRSGWAVVALQRSGVDMLLIGPNEALVPQYDAEGEVVSKDIHSLLMEKTRSDPDVYVVPIEELWKAYPDVVPIRLSNPPAERLADTPRIEGLRNYLEKTRKIIELQRGKDE